MIYIALLLFAYACERAYAVYSDRPDFIIGGADNPYIKRWYLTPWRSLRDRAEVGQKLVKSQKRHNWLTRAINNVTTNWPNVYLHRVIRDDDARGLHDHPFANVSIILKGSYNEVQPISDDLEVWRQLGSPKFSILRPFFRCQLMKRRLRPGSVVFRKADFMHRLEVVEGPVWSLFLMGPRTRSWGFHTVEQGWLPWQEMADPEDPGKCRKQHSVAS